LVFSSKKKKIKTSQKLSTKRFTFLLFKKEDVVVTLIRIDEFQSLLRVYFFVLWTLSNSLRVKVV